MSRQLLNNTRFLIISDRLIGVTGDLCSALILDLFDLRHSTQEWIFETMAGIKKALFNHWSISTIKRAIALLEEKKFIIAEILPNSSKKYQLNYELINKLTNEDNLKKVPVAQNEPGVAQNEPGDTIYIKNTISNTLLNTQAAGVNFSSHQAQETVILEVEGQKINEASKRNLLPQIKDFSQNTRKVTDTEINPNSGQNNADLIKTTKNLGSERSKETKTELTELIVPISEKVANPCYGKSALQIQKEIALKNSVKYSGYFSLVDVEIDFYCQLVCYHKATSPNLTPGQWEAFATATCRRIRDGSWQPKDYLRLQEYHSGELKKYQNLTFDKQETKKEQQIANMRETLKKIGLIGG
jgi:hypothetical protein